MLETMRARILLSHTRHALDGATLPGLSRLDGGTGNEDGEQQDI